MKKKRPPGRRWPGSEQVFEVRDSMDKQSAFMDIRNLLMRSLDLAPVKSRLRLKKLSQFIWEQLE